MSTVIYTWMEQCYIYNYVYNYSTVNTQCRVDSKSNENGK